jgi:NDMA-dependent alcohol dehydrogenase
MKTRAAVLREAPGHYIVEDVELDDPQTGEVLVEMVASGFCHSNDHIVNGDTKVAHLPMVLGHEGSGIVRKVGAGVRSLEVGDHIITSFIPACGRCRWCASGMQNLCDNGALMTIGHQLDGTYRMHTSDGLDIATEGLLGTFAEWQVFDELSCVKIDKDLPLEVACLVACGVQTGYGSATVAGNVQPGDVVLIAGVGGVGMNAVQGSVHRGAAHIIAVDPVEQKRAWAYDFGATDAFESIDAANDRLRHLTNGQGADVAILAASLVRGDLIREGFNAIRKAGTLVIAGASSESDEGIPGINARQIAFMQKRIQGALYGMKSPREAMPILLNMYRAGTLKLDELVTNTYTLDAINQASADLHDGKNIRGVIRYDLSTVNTANHSEPPQSR